MFSGDRQDEPRSSLNTLPHSPVRLPGIHDLFPELSDWSRGQISTPAGPSLLSKRIPRQTHTHFAAPHNTIPVNYETSLAASSNIYSSTPHRRSQHSPRPPHIQTLVPSQPSTSLAQRLGTQLRRPRSSPVSPSDDRRAAWDSQNRHIDRRIHRRYSFSQTFPPTLPPRMETVSMSVHSTPDQKPSHLASTSRGRAGSVGSVASDASSRPSTSRAPPARYKCQYCPKRFSRPSSLRIHENSHTGAKPFECPEPGCGRHFSVMSNMRRHQKTHRPKAPSDYSAIESDYSGGDDGMDVATPTPHDDFPGIERPSAPSSLSSPSSYTSPELIRTDVYSRAGGQPMLDIMSQPRMTSVRPFTSPA